MATLIFYTPNLDDGSVWFGTMVVSTSTHLQIVSETRTLNYFGSDLNVDASGNFISGVLNGTDYLLSGVRQWAVTGLNHSMVTINGYIQSNDSEGYTAFLFGGSDTILGSSGDDILNAYAGDDSLEPVMDLYFEGGYGT